MVNTGKPSRGCYMCRARRIKCDEAKPHCMRCQKSKRACPGYRDAFELNHRDETRSTRRKIPHGHGKNDSTFIDFSRGYGGVARTNPVWMYNPNVSTSHYNQFDQQHPQLHPRPVQRSTQISILHHLSTPLDQQASCFFLSNYVLLPQTQQGVLTRHLDFLIPLLKIAKPNSPMDLTFSAVAMAAFGSRPGSRHLLQRADYYYTKALKAINTALKDPEMSMDDATLASVILLSTFEQLIASRKSAMNWVSHIDGAVALIKARGKSQFNSSLGQDLFLAVRTYVAVRCITRSEPISFSVEWWMNQFGEHDAIREVNEMNLKVGQLRADAEEIVKKIYRTASNTEQVLKLLRRSESLEQQYVEWEKSLPESWRAKTVAWIDNAEGDIADSAVFPGRVDSYLELGAGMLHNITRSCRLFIWTTTLRCIAWLGEPQDYRLTPEYAIASRVCNQIIEDIVASIPFFFGWNRNGTVQMASKLTNFACGTNERSSTIKGVAGIFVLWPLFTAYSSDFATPSQQLFLKGRMQCIYETTGMAQANVLLNTTISHPSMFIQRERLNMKFANSSDSSQVRISCGRGLELDTTNTKDSEPMVFDEQLTPPNSAPSNSPKDSSWMPSSTTRDNSSPHPSTLLTSNSDWVPRGSFEDNGGAHDLGYLNDYADLNFGEEDYGFSKLVSV